VTSPLTEKLPLGSPLFFGNEAKPNKKTLYTMAMEAIVVNILSHIPN
jgi:hypothetical protein